MRRVDVIEINLHVIFFYNTKNTKFYPSLISLHISCHCSGFFSLLLHRFFELPHISHTGKCQHLPFVQLQWLVQVQYPQTQVHSSAHTTLYFVEAWIVYFAQICVSKLFSQFMYESVRLALLTFVCIAMQTSVVFNLLSCL